MTMETDASLRLSPETPEALIDRITDFGPGDFWLLSQEEASQARESWGD